MLASIELSPRIEGFLAALSREPGDVRAMWRYAVFLLLVKHGCAQILDTRREGETCYLVIETASGECYDVVRPDLSPQEEESLMRRVREMIREQDG